MALTRQIEQFKDFEILFKRENRSEEDKVTKFVLLKKKLRVL